jgi:hypothetical protein
MKILEDFEELFALRKDHSDDDLWTGVLKFSVEEGSSLLTVTKITDVDKRDLKASFEKDALTGYIDYDRPATLVNTWLKVVPPETTCSNVYPVSRCKAKIVVNGILKDIHLTDIDEPCFAGFSVNMPSFHAWYRPSCIEYNSDMNCRPTKEEPIPIVTRVTHPEEETFKLSDGAEIKIFGDAIPRREDNEVIVEEYTNLNYLLPKTSALNEAVKIRARINILFSFIVGQKMAVVPLKLKQRICGIVMVKSGLSMPSIFIDLFSTVMLKPFTNRKPFSRVRLVA